jgi:hypothetical protein
LCGLSVPAAITVPAIGLASTHVMIATRTIFRMFMGFT